MESNISLIASFTAGIISFISPCVLPIVPAYLSFITGVSVEVIEDKKGRSKALKRIILNTLFFVLGLSIVFVAMGAGAAFLGSSFSFTNNPIFTKIGGVIVIFFGLHFLGAFRISWLNYEKRFHLREKPIGILGSFIIGLAFAFGWTPCIGAILGSILVLASNSQTVGQGMFLLLFYSLGLGIPFLLVGVGFNYFIGIFSFIKRHFKVIEIIGGVFLIIIGFLLFFNLLGYISEVLIRLFPWLSFEV
jgi:cytochrome c-type biogenesis protein